MRASCIQLNIKWEDQEVNYIRARKLIREVAKGGAELVCLPELFSTGVTMNSGVFAESHRGETCRFLSQEAKNNRIHLVGSFIEENGGRLPYNTFVVHNPHGRLISKYHKTNLFTYGGEDAAYTPGDGKIPIIKIHGFSVSPLICYDIRFPGLSWAAVDKGANLLIVPANWPRGRIYQWIILLQARAVENMAYVIGVNQVGCSPRNRFPGHSMIIGPVGEILGKAGAKETVLTRDLDLKELQHYRREFPALRDRSRSLG